MPLALPLADPLADFIADPEIDLVISAMCLSQMPRAVENLLAQTAMAESEQRKICKAVVENHPCIFGQIFMRNHSAE